ncbi:MAG TPA: iron ABC transporter substrate-binding protein [Bacteroidetes bacterium]|nr:iron ABC transporter substrate-binding protein [Bacteroidota bacterium]
MKKLMRNTLLYPALLFSLLTACVSPASREAGTRELVDAAGREVHVPDTVRSVIALRSGALRLLCYLDVAGRVQYIEGNEQRRDVPYLFANPFLRELPLIGAGNHYDPELLATAGVDLIVATYMSRQEAARLQQVARTPVFVLEYGDLNRKKDDLYHSLKMLGKIFYREARADSLIGFMEETMSEYLRRADRGRAGEISAYVGGVAYRGAHGITSTEPVYPPFRFLGIRNCGETLGEVVSSPVTSQENAFIEKEQLIAWNPDYLFLDVAGRQIWAEEIEQEVLKENLKAVRQQQVYTVLPYNWYATNFGNLFCNTWYIGKVIFPECFSDVDPRQKCREIYRFFLGKDVFERMQEYYRPFEQIRITGAGS